MRLNAPLRDATLLTSVGALGGVGMVFLAKASWFDDHQAFVSGVVLVMFLSCTYWVILRFRQRGENPIAPFQAGVAGVLFGWVVTLAYQVHAGSVADPKPQGLDTALTTAAAVSSALLIALVVEASSRRSQGAIPNDDQLRGVYFIVLGLGANMVALVPYPQDIEWMSIALLGVVTGCLSASLAAVLSIAGELARGLVSNQPAETGSGDPGRTSRTGSKPTP